MAAVEVQSETSAFLQEKCPKEELNETLEAPKEAMELPPTIENVVVNKEQDEEEVTDPVSDVTLAKEVETGLEIDNKEEEEEEALESEKPNEEEIEKDSENTQKAVPVVPVDEPEEVEEAKKEGVNIFDEASKETKEEKEEKAEIEEASKEAGTCEKSDE